MSAIKSCSCGHTPVMEWRRSEEESDLLFFRILCKHCGMRGKSSKNPHNAVIDWNHKQGLKEITHV